ncbi:VOC family protein [Anaeroselena agilis]|uniref:VOC family protein n=1 Tax=Anaeroselena agilis TaxID=3063788 RepID=A0ABU3P4W6_9FIRM|nr:VOC family protein [Selenomonadales bacterium 4137-cl]
MADNINPVIWFEIPVTDMPRGKAFYEAVFGHKLEIVDMGERQMAMFPMAMNAIGAGGALVKAEHYVPSYTGAIIYFAVADIAATLDKVAASKGKTLVPKTDIGQYGFFGLFEDSEGNCIGLHSM